MMQRFLVIWPPIRTAVLFLLGLCLVSAGCVHRQLTITTDPPGAMVQVNGKTVGPSPVDVPFTYYGDYRITVLRDGYETLTVDEPVSAPWFEYFPLDFVSEHLIPWTVQDIRHRHYPLSPLQVVPPNVVLERSEQLRQQGQGIGVPPAGFPGSLPPGSVGVPAVPFAPLSPGSVPANQPPAAQLGNPVVPN